MTAADRHPVGALSAAPDAAHRRGWVFAVLLVAVLGLLAVFGLAVLRPGLDPRVGQVAPDFTLTTYGGEEIALSSLRGQVVLVNFWASWCVPCAQEARELVAMAEDYRARGLTVLGVAFTDTEPAARAYLARHGVSYPNGPDRQGRISQAYRVSGVPETFLIDRSGRIAGLMVDGRPAAKLVGPVSADGAMSGAQLRAVIERLLAEGS